MEITHFSSSFLLYKGMGNRESDQMRFAQLQLDNTKQESARVDEQITTIVNVNNIKIKWRFDCFDFY
jgi:hypothetical protein